MPSYTELCRALAERLDRRDAEESLARTCAERLFAIFNEQLQIPPDGAKLVPAEAGADAESSYEPINVLRPVGESEWSFGIYLTLQSSGPAHGDPSGPRGRSFLLPFKFNAARSELTFFDEPPMPVEVEDAATLRRFCDEVSRSILRRIEGATHEACIGFHCVLDEGREIPPRGRRALRWAGF
jgi:hypothetical protein